MDFANLFSKEVGNTKSMNKILENHFKDIENGTFDPSGFCEGNLQ